MDIEAGQPDGQKRTLAMLSWSSVACASALISVTLPYDMRQQSPILVRAELAEAIRTIHKRTGAWPKDEGEILSASSLSKKESDPVHVTWMRSSFDSAKKIETAAYDCVVRKHRSVLKIRFEHKAKAD